MTSALPPIFLTNYESIREGKIDPARFTASFNRPNLTYRVEAKTQAYEQVRKFLEARPDDSGIIYCQSSIRTQITSSCQWSCSIDRSTNIYCCSCS